MGQTEANRMAIIQEASNRITAQRRTMDDELAMYESLNDTVAECLGETA